MINRDMRYSAYMGVLIGLLIGLFLLSGCATPRPTMETRHLSWSNKTLAWNTPTQHATVEMNQAGLLVLSIEGVKVAHKVNWCVEVVEYE